MFKLACLDEKTLALRFDKELAAEEYALAHSRVIRFPEQKYSRLYEAYLIPITPANLKYLRETFTPDQYIMDEDTQLIARHSELTEKQAVVREKRRWEYMFNDEVPELEYQHKTKPYKHQLVGLDAIHNIESFGLLMDMGTGKTKIIIDEVCWQIKEGRPQKVLIICPKTVIGTWIKEWQKHATEPYFIRLVRKPEGPQAQRR